VSEKAENKIKHTGVAIIGSGDEARRIAQGYIDSGIDITGVWCPDGGNGSAPADIKIFKSLEEPLTDPVTRAVEVCSAIQRRASDAIEAIKAGKAVSVRGPVAADVDQLNLLAAEIDRMGAAFRYLDPVRHHAPHALAKKLLDRGEIGIPNGIRVKVAAADIGVFKSGSIEEPLDRLTLAQWYLGPAAEIETLRNERSNVSILRFGEPHRFGNFEAVYAPDLDVPFSERPWDENIEITGTTGIIWINGFWGYIADKPPVIMRRFKRMVNFGADLVVDPRAAYARAAYTFAKSVSEDKFPEPGIARAAADLKLLLAAASGAENPGRVTIA